jgi:hypothetical protein
MQRPKNLYKSKSVFQPVAIMHFYRNLFDKYRLIQNTELPGAISARGNYAWFSKENQGFLA